MYVCELTSIPKTFLSVLWKKKHITGGTTTNFRGQKQCKKRSAQILKQMP